MVKQIKEKETWITSKKKVEPKDNALKTAKNQTWTKKQVLETEKKVVKDKTLKTEPKQAWVIKQTFCDIILLYKNFFHWNISKLIFYIYWFLLWVIVVITFALLYYVYTLITSWDFSLYTNLIISWKLTNNLFSNIVYLLSFIFSGVVFYFSYILLAKLNYSYIEWKRIWFFKNEFLNYRLFWKYISLTSLLFVVFLIPIIIFILVLYFVVSYYWWLNAVLNIVLTSRNNFFTIFSLVLFFVLILVEFYLFYRVIFSYFVLAFDDKTSQNWVFAILKKSFKETASFKIFIDFMKIFFVVFLLFYFIIYSTDMSISKTYKNLDKYISYMNLEEDAKSTAKSLNPYYYENLEINYSSFTSEEILILKNKYYNIQNVFGALSFLFFNGVFLMFFNSFYFRRLTKEWN